MIDDATFEFVRRLLEDRTGNRLDDDKAYLVQTRLNPLCPKYDFDSVNSLVHALRDTSRRLRIPAAAIEADMVELMLIHETYFFRDPRTFELLEKQLIPERLAQQDHNRRLRIWSAASSTGQEPYSIAMLLHDRFPEIAANWDVQIAASDISRNAVDGGRIGSYSDVDIGRGLPDSMRRRYLAQSNGAWMVSDSVRSLVSFTECHLGQRALPGPWDIVFLRNVLIYFPESVRQEILRRIHATLADGGYLILGGGESVQGHDELYERTNDALLLRRK